MKITKVQTAFVQVPAIEPLADGPAVKGEVRRLIAVKISTDQGIQGISIAFFGGAITPALKASIDALGALAVGMDPLTIEAVHHKFREAASGAGPGGVFTLASSAIDIALWDIKGKAFGKPVSELLGGYRKTVPTYASGALMRSFPLKHVVKAAEKLVKKGFRQMKTQLALPGDTNPPLEVERIKLIREAIGPKIDLMCDINQRWDVRQAISIGKQVEQYHMFWLEDVTTADDYAGLARVAAALDTPVAGGEYVYGTVPFRHMMEARSVDIPMIDLMRSCGITGFMKIAAMAEAFNLPVVSHLIPEIQVHTVAAVPNGLTVEYMPWTFQCYKEVPVPKNGMLTVPNKPGLGLEFDPKVVKF
ncbi:MAG: mandelate racemase/muconate lactonizing enzyme family protein [Betaproteobacteria bacterium]|nr:mandelate racemase/muconate lactonizing enzyme family protein [Betaproteobacteria bacterium]